MNADVQAARERVCDCSALKEYPEGYEVDEFNAALDAYAEAVRRATLQWAHGVTCGALDGRVCTAETCIIWAALEERAARAEQEAT